MAALDGGPRDTPDAAVAPDTSVPEIDSGPNLDPDLDPTITFEWDETPPGQGTCGPGTFAGSFSCTFDDNPLTPVAGQASFYLTEAGPEGVLALTGHLADPLGIGLPLFFIDLTGTLSCGSESVLHAEGNGGLAVGQPGMPAVAFNASLGGEYDPDTAEILGEVTLIFDANQVCRGSFSVGASP